MTIFDLKLNLLQVDAKDVAKPNKPDSLPRGLAPKKSEHHKPAPLSPILSVDATRADDVKVEVSKTEQKIFTSSTQRTAYSAESPAKSGPESRFRSTYVNDQVRTPTDFPDPRSPITKYCAVADGTRTPTDFTDPRSPTTKFTKFESNLHRSVVTKRTVVQNGEATTQVSESKSVTTRSDEDNAPATPEASPVIRDVNTRKETPHELKTDEPEKKLDTKIAESSSISEGGRSSSHAKTTEQTSTTEGGLRSSVTHVVETTSTLHQAPVQLVSVAGLTLAFLTQIVTKLNSVLCNASVSVCAPLTSSFCRRKLA